MRVSAARSAGMAYLVVRLNGRRVELCTLADDEQGLVEHYAWIPGARRLWLDDDEEPLLFTEEGIVEIFASDERAWAFYPDLPLVPAVTSGGP